MTGSILCNTVGHTISHQTVTRLHNRNIKVLIIHCHNLNYRQVLLNFLTVCVPSIGFQNTRQNSGSLLSACVHVLVSLS